MSYLFGLLACLLVLPLPLAAQQGAHTEAQLVQSLAEYLRDNNVEEAQRLYLPEDAFVESRNRYAQAHPGKMTLTEKDAKQLYAQLRQMTARSWIRLQQQWHSLGLTPGTLQLQRHEIRPVGTNMGIPGVEGGMLKLYLYGQLADGKSPIYAVQIDVVRMDGVWYWVGEFVQVAN